MSNWLLPENISDVLPQEARRVEDLRRALLDLYRGFGYEYVIPPLIEHLDSLLSGTDPELDLRTFKLVDQSSGRSLGVRADATPQAARIDDGESAVGADDRGGLLGGVGAEKCHGAFPPANLTPNRAPGGFALIPGRRIAG